jgi:hypothetical protein
MTYDAGDRRASLAAEVDSSDDFLNSYSYDDLGRLTRVTQMNIRAATAWRKSGWILRE